MVEPKSETSLEVSWGQPIENSRSITHYLVNISALPGFDTLTYAATSPSTDTKSKKDPQPYSAQFKVIEFVPLFPFLCLPETL